MPRPLFLLLASMLAAFAAGLGLGLSARNGTAQPAIEGHTTAESATSDNSISDPGTNAAFLKSRITALENKLAEEKKQQDAQVLANRLALFKKDHLNYTAFYFDLKITPAMADLLELTPEEQTAVEKHLAEIQAQTQAFDEANVILVKRDGNTVTCAIPRYYSEAQGSAQKAELINMLNKDIGPERTDILMNNAGDAFKSIFSNFGAQASQFTITQVSNSNYVGYQIEESFTNGFLVAPYKISDIEAGSGPLPERWAKLVQHLPGP